MGREAVSVRNVVKRFGEFTAVNNVSLSINELEATSIIGPNGAGKTTLINIITGKLRPDQGRVYLYGEDITRAPPSRRVKLGLARTFQLLKVFGNMTVYQNLLVSALSQGVGDPEKAAEEMIKRFGLSEHRDLVASKLPHGIQRVLEIAMALATGPKVLMLDEPTAGLNPSERSTIVSVLEDLKKSTTLVIVEHDMDVVFTISQRIVVMHRGEVIADGDPEEISRNPRVREIYLG